MNGNNEAYRKSLHRVDQTSFEYEEKQQLEDKHRAVMDKYKYKRRQIKELQEDLQVGSELQYKASCFQKSTETVL